MSIKEEVVLDGVNSECGEDLLEDPAALGDSFSCPSASVVATHLNASEPMLLGSLAHDAKQVRRSTRDIKRPKFADEYVESSFPAAKASPRKLRGSGDAKSPPPPIEEPPVASRKRPAVAERRETKTESPTEPPAKKRARNDAADDAPTAESRRKGQKRSVRACRESGEGVRPTREPDRPKKPLARAKPAAPVCAKAVGSGSAGKVMRELLREGSASGASADKIKYAAGGASAAALDDVGRWTATDDLALITAVLQVQDLRKVFVGVKFSCKFTLEDVQQRWYALLYDPLISRLAVEAMRQLSADVVLQVQSKTLFSKKEEWLLQNVPVATTAPQEEELFARLLADNRNVFHEARTPRSLRNHWQLLRHNRLLSEQRLAPWPKGGGISEMSFSGESVYSAIDEAAADIEDNLDADVEGPSTSAGGAVARGELRAGERRLNGEIRLLENELPKWQVLVESVTGITPPDFDLQTMAVLRGRLVRFLVRSREVTLGRNTRHQQVDIDLSLEGPAFKISRKQATIKMRPSGDFCITNDGKRPLFIDGKPIVCGCKTKLNNNAVIEVSVKDAADDSGALQIANLRLVFLINQDLMTKLRNEATKMMIT